MQIKIVLEKESIRHRYLFPIRFIWKMVTNDMNQLLECSKRLKLVILQASCSLNAIYFLEFICLYSCLISRTIDYLLAKSETYLDENHHFNSSISQFVRYNRQDTPFYTHIL